MLSSNGLFGLTLVSEQKSRREYLHKEATFVIGPTGESYQVLLKNGSTRRVMVVLTVEGLCAIDGLEQADSGLGYILEPYQPLLIDGWRFLLSPAEYIPFRFSDLPILTPTPMDEPTNRGTIIATFFYEQRKPRYRANYATQSGLTAKKQRGLVWAGGTTEKWLQQQFAKEDTETATLVIQYEETEVLRRMGVTNLPAK